jgi:hypothetical protein
MKPGVALKDGSKIFGGQNYNESRQNQQDLATYKKYREQRQSEAEAKTVEQIKRQKQFERQE